MAKFNIKALTTDYIEEEIEADTLEQAQEKLIKKYDSGEVEAQEGFIFFEGDDAYDLVKEIMDSSEDDEEESEDEECECDDCKDCSCCK